MLFENKIHRLKDLFTPIPVPFQRWLLEKTRRYHSIIVIAHLISVVLLSVFDIVSNKFSYQYPFRLAYLAIDIGILALFKTKFVKHIDLVILFGLSLVVILSRINDVRIFNMANDPTLLDSMDIPSYILVHAATTLPHYRQWFLSLVIPLVFLIAFPISRACYKTDKTFIELGSIVIFVQVMFVCYGGITAHYIKFELMIRTYIADHSFDKSQNSKFDENNKSIERTTVATEGEESEKTGTIKREATIPELAEAEASQQIGPESDNNKSQGDGLASVKTKSDSEGLSKKPSIKKSSDNNSPDLSRKTVEGSSPSMSRNTESAKAKSEGDGLATKPSLKRKGSAHVDAIKKNYTAAKQISKKVLLTKFSDPNWENKCKFIDFRDTLRVLRRSLPLNVFAVVVSTIVQSAIGARALDSTILIIAMQGGSFLIFAVIVFSVIKSLKIQFPKKTEKDNITGMPIDLNIYKKNNILETLIFVVSCIALNCFLIAFNTINNQQEVFMTYIDSVTTLRMRRSTLFIFTFAMLIESIILYSIFKSSESHYAAAYMEIIKALAYGSVEGLVFGYYLVYLRRNLFEKNAQIDAHSSQQSSKTSEA